MKARIKATGEVVEVELSKATLQIETPAYEYAISENKQRLIPPFELEFEKDIDWEQRTWDAAVAIMVAYIQNEGDREEIPKWAVERAKDLVAEYRKGE